MKKDNFTQPDRIFTTPGYEQHRSKNNKSQLFYKSSSNHPPIWIERYPVEIQAGPVGLNGFLSMPDQPTGLVVFIDSARGSSSHSYGEHIAAHLNSAGLATLRFGLLTLEEEEQDALTAHLSVDVSLMARRAIGALDWLNQQPVAKEMKLGCYGAGSGAAATLIAATERPEITSAVVVRGGRSDLIFSTLPRVRVPVMLLVDKSQHNTQSLSKVDGNQSRQVQMISGASKLFGEPERCDEVAAHARDWFLKHLGFTGKPTPRGLEI